MRQICQWPLASVGLLLLLSLWSGAVAQPASPQLPTVLILGDSISIGYTPFVQRQLADVATVVRPTLKNGRPENCSGTTRGVTEIDRWLTIADGQFAVIHFNWGLHDLKHVQADGSNSDDPLAPPQATLAAYEQNLRQIVAKLKATKARLIFATTTPVPTGSSPFRSDADVIKYNDIAKKIMAEHGIAVNDLYAYCLPQLSDLQRPANVHFTDHGSEQLATQVSSSIRQTMTAP